MNQRNKTNRRVATTSQRSESGKGNGAPNSAHTILEAPFQERGVLSARKSAQRFVGIFAALVVLIFFFTSTKFFLKSIFPPYLHLNAGGTARILAALGEDAVANEAVVSTPRFALEIRRGCDAVDPISVLIAAIFAFPTTLKHQISGVVVGSLWLTLLNMLRIVSLYYVGVHVPAAFDLVHVDIWQPLFLLLAILFWILWVRRLLQKQDGLIDGYA